MTGEPFVPLDGGAGLTYLRRTRPTQTLTMARDPAVAAEITYFRTAILLRNTPDAVVSDSRLRAFLTTAFGAEDLRGDQTTLRRALGESTSGPRALAVHHDDLRLREMAQTLGMGDLGGAFGPSDAVTSEELAARTALRAATIDAVVGRYLAATFEQRVTAVDKDLGQALAFDRLSAAAARLDGPEALKWERMLDDPAMTRVLERALSLPDDFAALSEKQRIAAVDAAYRRDFGGDADMLRLTNRRDGVAKAFFAWDPFADTPAPDPRTLAPYTPIVAQGGVAGWAYLQRTLDTQRAAFDRTPELARDLAYFQANIGKATTAEKLVEDPRLLRVALGAFGLGDEFYKKAYVRKALAEGTETEGAMATRIADPKYRELVAAFGYGDAKGAQVGEAAFVKNVMARHRERAFEIAVGEVDPSMRLSMNFAREAAVIAGSSSRTERAAIFRLLGDPPLRSVVETALGLPADFRKLDLDRQASVIADRFASVFGGGVKTLADPAVRERVVRGYLVREQIAANAASAPASGALAVLQNVSAGLRANSVSLFARF